MEKRLILTIVLSMLVLFIWSAIMPKPVKPKNQPTATSLPNQLENKELGDKTSVLQQNSAVGKKIDFTTKNAQIIFLEESAAIQTVAFNAYQGEKFQLNTGLFLDLPDTVFHMKSASSDKIEFEYKDGTKKINKAFIFSKDNYNLELDITVGNLSNLDIKLDLPVLLGTIDFSQKQNKNQANFLDIFISSEKQDAHYNGRKDVRIADTKFMSLRDKYFCLIVQPDTKEEAFVQKISSDKSSVGFHDEITIQPGGKFNEKFSIYLGPQNLALINALNPRWAAVVHYGTFDLISQVLLQLLEFIQRIVHSWGLAIIILSTLVFLLLYPISLKQMRSIKEMQLLQPKIEEIRKTYKDNPQKLNKEILEIYREHKVNPLGGCLPLLLQMPVFFALYQVLMRSVALKGAHFLWIKDLSEPDKLFTLPVTLPVVGNEFNLLPLLMTGLMFFQQKFSMPSSTSQSAEQQKILGLLMPLLFGFIFYRMPSGLVLYWFINSLLMLLFQLRVNQAK